MFDSSDFYLTGSVGSQYGGSRPHDVVRIRRALDETGYGRSPDNPSSRYDRSIYDNIVGFQDDFGLKKDGNLKSGGPTETALNLALDAKRVGGKDAMEALREPFAAFNQDGFQFLPNASRLTDKTHNWVSPDGKTMTDDQRDSVLVSKQRGNQIKRLPFNDPTVEFERPNPIAPLAKDVFGEYAVSTPPPTPLKAEPESLSMATKAEAPESAPAPTQIAQAAPAAKPNSAQSQGKQTTTSNWAANNSTKRRPVNNPKSDPLPTSKISAQWRIAIHEKESSGHNYQANNGSGNALGRYQLTKIALQEAGMKDANGNWTGTHGVNSEKQFLDNALAQEKALEAYLGKVETQLNKNGSMGFVGQKVQGKKAVITLTEGGLMAAAHRWGTGRVHEYLSHLKGNNWVTDESKFPAGRKDSYLAVEILPRERIALPDAEIETVELTSGINPSLTVHFHVASPVEQDRVEIFGHCLISAMDAFCERHGIPLPRGNQKQLGCANGELVMFYWVHRGPRFSSPAFA